MDLVAFVYIFCRHSSFTLIDEHCMDIGPGQGFATGLNVCTRLAARGGFCVCTFFQQMLTSCALMPPRQYLVSKVI